MENTCVVEGCERAVKIKSRSWCMKHYKRWYRYGDVEGFAPRQPVEERFWEKVEFSMYCWEWKASLDRKGYGQFMYTTHTLKRAHRVAYELMFGESPGEFDLDHRCFNRACVSPFHIRLATTEQNNENRQGPYKNSYSGRRGVFPRVKGVSWYAQTIHKGAPQTSHTIPWYEIHAAEYYARKYRLELHTFNDLDRQ